MATYNTIYKLSTAKLNERFISHFGYLPPALSRSARAEAIFNYEQDAEWPAFVARPADNKDLEDAMSDNDRGVTVVQTEIAGLPVTIEVEPESNRRNAGAVVKMMGITSADYFFIKNTFDSTLVEWVVDMAFLNIKNNIALGSYPTDDIIELWLATVADFRMRFSQLNDAMQKDTENTTHNQRKAMSIANRWLAKRTDRAVRGYINKVRRALAELNL